MPRSSIDVVRTPKIGPGLGFQGELTLRTQPGELVGDFDHFGIGDRPALAVVTGRQAEFLPHPLAGFHFNLAADPQAHIRPGDPDKAFAALGAGLLEAKRLGDRQLRGAALR